MSTEKRWDGPAAMRTCETAADFRQIAFELSNDSDPASAAHWALPHHPRPGAEADPGGVSAALGRLNQTGPTVMSKESIRSHLERHQGSEEESLMRPVDADSRIIEYGGKSIKLRTLADAWDTARREHYVLDPYKFEDIKISELRAGPPKGGFSIRGYAAVYGVPSHNLGGFTEEIREGFFASVLERQPPPDVHALWDHDTRYTLARTLNGTLDLRDEPKGLYNWIKVAPTSYAQDLRILMDRGDIDGASFAFTVDEDEFTEDEEGNIRRTLIRARDLYDTTVTAQGAYPQANAEVAERAIRSVLDMGRSTFAVTAGKRSSQPATAASPAADGAAEGQAVSEPDSEEFARWKAAREMKNAAARSSLAKLAERLERLKDGD